MLDHNDIETVDAQPVVALDTTVDGPQPSCPHSSPPSSPNCSRTPSATPRRSGAQHQRAHASDWNQFTTWCERYQLTRLPATAAVVGLYLTSLAKCGLVVSTIRRRAGAIPRAHRQNGQLPATSDPRVQTVLEGIARVHGSAPNEKTALLRDPLLELIDRIDVSSTAGLRDRALLLLGVAVGLRRSELVALTIEDLSPSPYGITLRIARSKTDQQGRGQELLVVYAAPGRARFGMSPAHLRDAGLPRRGDARGDRRAADAPLTVFSVDLRAPDAGGPPAGAGRSPCP
jgi:hypothetical protein